MTEGKSKLAACPLLAHWHGIDVYEEGWWKKLAPDSGHRVNCGALESIGCGECGLFAAAIDGHEIELAWACFRCLPSRPEAYLGYYEDGPCGWCGRDAIVLNALDLSRLPESERPKAL